MLDFTELVALSSNGYLRKDKTTKRVTYYHTLNSSIASWLESVAMFLLNYAFIR